MLRKVPHACNAAITLRKEEVAGFVLTETVYARYLKLPKHSHEHTSFSLVLQGGFDEKFRSQSRTCEPATLVFLPSGEVHSDHFLIASRCFNFEIAPEWLARVSPNSAIPEYSVDFRSGPLTGLATKLLREFRAMDAVASLAIEGLALEIVAELARCNLNKTMGPLPICRLEEARDFLHAHFSEQVSLACVAANIGMHPVYLARAFRKRYCCSVGEYVRRLRIAFACREFSATDIPVAQVAQTAGFFDQSHLTRTFRLTTGMSPLAYRKLYRQG
jgi:AraC family transcriptional regulator